MVDAMTLIMIILMTIVLIITNIYILIYFSHPDDKESVIGWILKIIVIIGLTLAWCQVLMVPLDVSNNRTFGGGINMKLFWFIIFVITLVYILVIFPISSSLYETQEDWTVCEKIKHSLCYFLVQIIFFIAITGILYATIGETSIPIKKIEYNDNCGNIEFNSDKPINMDELRGLQCEWKSKDENVELNVNIIVYSMAVLTFISWLVFALFGGIGLASVPLDFFVSFKSRPKVLTSDDIKKRRKICFDEIEELRKMGEDLKKLEDSGANRKWFLSADRRKYNRMKNEFIQRFTLVKKEFDIINKKNLLVENCGAVFYYLLLPLGILSTILSLLWLIQFICSYFYIWDDGRPGYPFLSFALIYFQDHDVSFLSFLFFSLLTLYLLFCVIKGNFQFGVRILCCWTVHPMEKGKTFMNSFLFNISLILLGSMAITQFVSDCLSDYVVFTDIDTLFNTLIKNLKFFKYFYKNHIFQYIFFAIFVVSLIYMIYQLCKAKESIKEKSAITENKEKEEKKKKKKKDKNKNKNDVKIDIDEKKGTKIEKKNSKKNSDKITEDSNSSDKMSGNNKKINDNKDISEEKLDADNNENNINNISNSFDNDL